MAGSSLVLGGLGRLGLFAGPAVFYLEVMGLRPEFSGPREHDNASADAATVGEARSATSWLIAT